MVPAPWLESRRKPNGSWVLLFHGVADNRIGVIGPSEFLLRAGYSVVMMDIRAHGASGGPIAPTAGSNAATPAPSSTPCSLGTRRAGLARRFLLYLICSSTSLTLPPLLP